eukprot:TRINITY_DN18625_c0_g1_i1.p1 TRINITY_DN18625_c0_g1~~TRINITY_DN18625_c0_g1_i1.p1  ORF type:complete len:547 (-),score=115.12 TRINITY_DN18625_c0_g1_i1:525-2165(-)
MCIRDRVYYDPNDPNAPQEYYDPNDPNYDPNTVPEIPGYEGWGYDPQTGAYIDPVTGTYVNPETGYAIDPTTGYSIDPVSGDFIDPETGQTFTAEEAAQANEEYAAEEARLKEQGVYYDGYNDYDDQEVDTSEYIDVKRAVKFSKPGGRQKSQSHFSGSEMRILWLERLDSRTRRKNWILFFLCMLGIVFMMIHLLVNWNSDTLEIEGTTGSAILLKFGIGFSTISALCALFDYYQLEVYTYRKYLKPQGEEVSELGWPVSFLVCFLAECAVIAIHPIPYVSDDKVGLLMFLRLYLIVRLIRDSSSVYHERHTIADKAYQDRGGPVFDWVLILRLTFDEIPGSCLTAMFLLLSLVCGFCNYICGREDPSSEQDFDYIKAVWGSAMLLSTGMPKQAASSSWSQAIEVLTVVLGSLMFAMVLAVIHNAVVLRPKDRYGMKCIGSIHRQEQLHKNSAILIQSWWRLLRMEKKNRITTQDYLDFSSVCTRHKRVHERLRVQEKSSIDPTMDTLLSLDKSFTDLKKDVSDIRIAQDIMVSRARELKLAQRH